MGAKGLRAASIPRRLLVVADAVVALGLGVATVPAVLAAGTRVQAWTAGLLAAVICLAVATRRRWPC
jgi:hypothetical protein